MDPRALTYLKELNDLSIKKGFPIYVVGGTIRDFLMARPCVDYDITSPQSTDLVQVFCKSHNFKAINLDDTPGRETHRVIIDKNLYFDFCRMQGKDIYEDLKQRDFTINSMAVALEDFMRGHIEPIDPHGGKNDIARKQIRALPGPVFESDPLRLLRAFRFASTLDFEINKETLEAISQNKDSISRVAHERIIYELFLFLEAHNPDMENLATTGLLESMIPELSSLRNVSLEISEKDPLQFTLCVLGNLDKLTSSPDILFKDYEERIRDFLAPNNYRPLMRLAALFQGLDDSPRTGPASPKRQPETLPLKVMKRMRASNADATGMDRILFFHNYVLEKRQDFADEQSDFSAIYKFVKDSGQELVPALLLAAAVFESKYKNENSFQKVVYKIYDFYCNQYLPAQESPKLLDGNDLSRLFNLEPSPIFKTVLEGVEQARVLGTIKTGKEAEALARDLIESL